MFIDKFISGLPVFLIGLALTVLGMYFLRRAQPTFFVRIGSASGESDALSSKNDAEIQEIVNALNEAIIKRG
jgi:hypothetical protein